MTLSPAEAQSLFFIALGALIIPMLSRRVNLPSAVGELVYGLALGPHAFGLLKKSGFIELMAGLGFAILMFSAGMEIDFAPLRRRGARLLPLTIGWTALVAAFSIFGGMAMGFEPWVTLAMAAVSIGLASVVLRERKLLSSRMGQAVLTGGLFGESLSILFLAALDLHHRFNFSADFYLSLFQFAGIFILAYLLLRVFRFLIWWFPERAAAFVGTEDPLEPGVRLSVALLFIFLAAASVLGVEAILGAFIAGSLFGFLFQEREAVAEKMNAMGQGFFVPFFFIVVGSHFDPRSFLAGLSSPFLLELLLFALAVKLIPSLLFRLLGIGWKELLASSLLLASPLTLTVAVAEVGYSTGALNRETQGTLVLAAIISGLLFPFLARLLLPRTSPEAEAVKREGEKRSGAHSPGPD